MLGGLHVIQSQGCFRCFKGGQSQKENTTREEKKETQSSPKNQTKPKGEQKAF
jgi:hypothetical protein